jgi:hypothetical protein
LFFDGGGGNNCNPIFTDILKDCDFNTVYQLLSKNDNEASSFYNSQRERLMIRYAAVVHVLVWEHKPTDITISDPNLSKNTHDTPDNQWRSSANNLYPLPEADYLRLGSHRDDLEIDLGWNAVCDFIGCCEVDPSQSA